jgi:hypothetical protein
VNRLRNGKSGIIRRLPQKAAFRGGFLLLANRSFPAHSIRKWKRFLRPPPLRFTESGNPALQTAYTALKQ